MQELPAEYGACITGHTQLGVPGVKYQGEGELEEFPAEYGT